MGLIECACGLTGGFGRVIAIFYFIFFMGMGLNTVLGVEFFLSSTVYTFDSKPMILLMFSLLLLYTLCSGVEPLARASVIVCAVFLPVAALLFAALLPQFDLDRIYSPFYHGVRPYLQKLPVAVAQNDMFMPLFILAPLLKKGRDRVFTSAALIHLAVTELLMFASLAVLGDYSPSGLFSMYTLVTLLDNSNIHRVDSIHIGLWVLLCFIRAATVLFCACICLESAVPARSGRFVIPFSVLIFFAGGCLLSQSYGIVDAVFGTMYSGLPTLAAELLIPLALLIISLIRKKKHALP